MMTNKDTTHNNKYFHEPLLRKSNENMVGTVPIAS